MAQTFYSKRYNLESYRKHLFPHSVCPTYDKAAFEIAEILHGDQTYENKMKNLMKFTQKFTTGHEIWQEWNMLQINKAEKDGTYNKEKINELGIKQFLNFCESFPVLNRLPKGCIKLISSEEYPLRVQLKHYTILLKILIENDFDYEIDMLSICDTFWNFRQNLVQITFQFFWFEINITNYNSLKNLSLIEEYLNIFQKIAILQFNENNAKSIKKYQWIEALKETENAEYIIKNIEASMAYDNTITELKKKWKLLFHFSHKYIKELNGNEKSLTNLLEVYRRYCRYFVDDLITRKKYRKTIAKTTKKFDNTKWILDSIKLEYDFGSQKNANEQLIKFGDERNVDTKIFTNNFMQNFKLMKELTTKMPLLPARIYFSKNGMFIQNFDFPSPLIKYICKNGNYEITKKIQQSSKQLFLITNKIQCIKFSISDIQETQYFQESIFTSTENPKKINNISIFNTLFVSCKNGSALSKFIPQICCCNIQFLIIRQQNLTLNEYNFLTNFKNIKRIAFENTVITNLNGGEKASLEEIMENLPNAENLGFIPSPSITDQTFLILQNLKRNVKIQSLQLSLITEKIIAADLCLFFKIHIANNSYIKICGNGNDDYLYLQPTINDMLDTWFPSSEKPIIKLRRWD